MIFFALMIGRYWKVLAGAIVSIIVITSITLIIFGYKIWIDYFNVISVPMELLEKGFADWGIMPTFFAAVLSAGFDVQTAYVVQGLVMLMVVTGITLTWVGKG